MRKIVFFLMMAFSGQMYGQTASCNCDQAFTELVNKIETEYPGFAFKTKDGLAYSNFKEKLAQSSKDATSAQCPALLKAYTDYFKDPHLWVGSNGAPFSGATSGKGKESINIHIPDFKNKILSGKDKLEGIWKNETYTIGLKKSNTNEYTGFIIESAYKEWKPKEIKFKLYNDNEFEYALLDGTTKTGTFRVIDNSILQLEDVSVQFVKYLPKPTLSEGELSQKLGELNGFYIKRLSSRTAIIKLPSFDYKYMRTIDSLISNNKDLLESENLIIDLRGNGGGTTDAYQKLLPYISGKAIRNTGTEFLATQTYIDNLKAYKKTLDKDTSATDTDDHIKRLENNLGKFVNFSGSQHPEVAIEQIAVSPKSPRHIIILANGMTGSSAEYFLFIAKQSKKVKIFGKPSYGALDYGNAYLVNLKCSGYQVFLPTYRALRLPDYPIDNIGIQPDVYMDKSIEDWIAFAVDYLEN
ncbi:S41 family peptidase [Mucilaginibacter sp. RS28]|uniref:S41 family peptidase n=1 Tax=Mucilaginibacter straminoryzae TaxID=2932774 RepID=A0A9X2BAS6_9SPHI|nr:S41 family peptidase [Mucilaginibacter straminoryzae]MCJ8209102.1 S41 family peptidase [Mucilaginibacter straminoryzae]